MPKEALIRERALMWGKALNISNFRFLTYFNFNYQKNQLRCFLQQFLFVNTLKNVLTLVHSGCGRYNTKNIISDDNILYYITRLHNSKSNVIKLNLYPIQSKIIYHQSISSFKANLFDYYFDKRHINHDINSELT